MEHIIAVIVQTTCKCTTMIIKIISPSADVTTIRGTRTTIITIKVVIGFRITQIKVKGQGGAKVENKATAEVVGKAMAKGQGVVKV